MITVRGEGAVEPVSHPTRRPQQSTRAKWSLAICTEPNEEATMGAEPF